MVTLLLCGVSTIYPTFKYGETRASHLKDSAHTSGLESNANYEGHVEARTYRTYSSGTMKLSESSIYLKRAFLLNSPEDRRLIVDQLILEYIVAVLIGSLIYSLQRVGSK